MSISDEGFMVAYHVKSSCLLLLCAALVVVSGCGRTGPDGRLPVSGKVTWKGEPLEEGNIMFKPMGDGLSSSAKIVAGEFDLPATRGLPVGSYKVEITYHQETGQEEHFPGDGPPGEMTKVTRQVIPKRYNRDSKLVLEVTESYEPVTFAMGND